MASCGAAWRTGVSHLASYQHVHVFVFLVRKWSPGKLPDPRLPLPRLDGFESCCRPGRRTNSYCSGQGASFLTEPPFFPPCKHGEHAASENMPQSGKEPVSCTTAQKQTFAIDRGKKLLLPIYVLKSRGLGEERGSTAAGSAYPLGYEFPPRAWSAAAERGSQRL